MTKPLFECDTCSRCGGSGNYSYNQINGTRCFGCNGSGHKLTKRGAAAQKFLDDLRSKPYEEVKVGDLIRVNMSIMGTKYVFKTVLSVVIMPLQDMGYISETDRTKMGVRIGVEGLDMIVFPGSPCRMGFSAEEKKAQQELALAYQETLTKAGVPSKVTK